MYFIPLKLYARRSAPHTFAEKGKDGRINIVTGASSCIKVIEGYWLRLGTNPNLRLGEYCMETHTNYRGVNYWAKRHRIEDLP